MVKHQNLHEKELDLIFQALSDPTRRKILERLQIASSTVSELKKPFKISLVAISKHLKILERANLVRRQKMGREHVIRIHPHPLRDAYKYIENYKTIWSKQLDALEKFLEKNG